MSVSDKILLLKCVLGVLYWGIFALYNFIEDRNVLATAAASTAIFDLMGVVLILVRFP